MEQYFSKTHFDASESAKTGPGEIMSILKRLKNRKAPVPDGINNLVLKNLPRMVLTYISLIF
jgi:hypothetical protein